MRGLTVSKWQRLTRLWQHHSDQGWQPRHFLVLLIITSTTLAVSTTALFSYQVLRGLILGNLKQNALLRVQDGVDAIDNWLAIRKAEITAIANTPTFRTMNWSVAESYVESESSRLKDFYFFAMINPDGSQNTSKQGRAKNVKDRQYFQQAMSGQVYVSDPVISRTHGGDTVPIGAPVWSSSPARAQPIGVIGAAIRIERIAQVVGNLNYGSGSYAFALNSQGMPIVHPDRSLMGTKEKPAPSFLQAKDPSLQRLAQLMVSKNQGIELMQLAGDRVYVAYLPLREANWSIALVIPRQNIESNLRALNYLATVMGVLLAIATIAALRQVRLSELSRARAAQEALLNRLIGRIRTSLELDRIVQTTVEEIGTLLQLEQAAFGWYDVQRHCIEIERICCGDRPCLQVGRFEVEPDFEARLQHSEQVRLKQTHPYSQPRQLELKPQSYLAIPVQTDNAPMGYLILVRNSRWFSRQGEQELLQAVADQLAIAITQSHLYIQTKKQAQQLALALDESEVRFRMAVDNIPDTFVIYNAHRQFQFVNADGLRRTGKPLEDLLGRTDEELWPSKVTANYLPILLRSVETRTIQTGECELTLPTVGSFALIVTYVPLLNEQGEIYQILGITHDITERKRAEVALHQLNQELENRVQQRTAELQQINVQLQAEIRERNQAEADLRKSQQQLQTLLDNSPTLIYLIDAQNRFLLVNRSYENLFSQTQAQVVGKSIYEVWSKEIADAFVAVNQQVLQHGMPIKIEEVAPHEDGLHTYLTIKFPLHDANGVPYAVWGISTDISDRKQAEHKLEQLTTELQRSNRELEEFASVVSHDLQEPLRAVTGFTQLLIQEYQDQLDESAQEYITYIVDAAVRMRQLIYDLLAYSRTSSCLQNVAPTDCNAVVREAIANLQVAIVQSNATITHDPLPTVSADKTQLLQLFQNLISNAVKFRRDERPQVHISVQLRNQEWLFAVRDNGIGIQAMYLEEIFEVFKRLHTRSEVSGTGIGLAICKKIVERHGGRIWTESQPGLGSIFYFTIPFTSHSI
jgi:PAS domain S-box-containing protein